MSWKQELRALRREAIEDTMRADAALKDPDKLRERTVHGWRIIMTRFVNENDEGVALRWHLSASTRGGTEKNLQRILDHLGVPKDASVTPGGIKVDGKTSNVRHYLWPEAVS